MKAKSMKKLMEKAVALGMGTVVTIGMLAGCGSSSETEAAKSSAPEEAAESSAPEASAPAEAASDGEIQVGIVLPTKDEPRWIQDESRFSSILDEAGFSYQVLFSQGNVATEKTNVETLISKGMDVLIICPHDATAVASTVEMAHDAGVKVISYDRLINDTAAIDYVVGFDSESVGTAQGNYLIENVEGTGNPLYLYAGATTDELEDIAEITVNPENALMQRSLELTKAVQEYFDGQMAVGFPDFGGVYDIVSSIRDANDLLLELHEDEEGVMNAAWNIHEQFKKIYREFENVIDISKIPGFTCWATMLSQKPYFVLQNDFSAMISAEMFDDFYLPILKKECQFIPRTIYHLDGPGAVRHLDSILTVEELDGVQWINGAGAPGLDQWPDIYRKIKAAGKLCQVFINGSEELRYIDDIVDILGTTEGLCFICTGKENEKEKFDAYLSKYHVTE